MSNGNKLMQNFHIFFGLLMVMFYLGAGIFLLFFADIFNIDRAVRGIIGTSFLIYGIFRAWTTYKQVKDTYFSGDDDAEE